MHYPLSIKMPHFS